jgi:hypothetical protein
MALSLFRTRRFGFSSIIRIRPLLLFLSVEMRVAAVFACGSFCFAADFFFAVVFAQWRLLLCVSSNSG